MRVPSFVAVASVAAAAAALGSGACDERFPAPLTVDAGAGDDAGALEASPPAMIAPESRKSASSSPIVFDPVRGGVWTANGDAGSISYVDVDARRVVAEIPIGADVRSIALSPDAVWIAAVDRDGASVTLVDAESRAPRRTIPLGAHPRACVWDSADPRWLYVAVEDDAVVAVVDRTLGVLASAIPVGRLPSGLAVSQSRRELYVMHRIDARVTVVDLDARRVAADVPLADEPLSDPAKPNGKPLAFESLAVTPDDSHAWVPHELLAPTHPLVFNRTLFPAVSVIDLVKRVETQTNPNDPAGAIAGRKNLFDAIAVLDSAGQPMVVSQPCAVAIHPNGVVAWAVACASEDLVVFDVSEGIATDVLRGLPGDHPAGVALDDTGARLFVASDQSHTLLTLDTSGGDIVGHTRPYGDPIALVAKDPIDPAMRAGLAAFLRANSAKGTPATTFDDWMSCGGCHLDGFGSANVALFESLHAGDPASDAQIGHVGLRDHFSKSPDPTFDPHDVLVALLDQGGLALDARGAQHVDADHPTPEAAALAKSLALVVARDLPAASSWARSAGKKPNAQWDAQWCGGCHQAEYAAWSKSLHAHAAEDPMVLHGVGVETKIVGPQYARFCAGCHDPSSLRRGDAPFAKGGGVTCTGCHDVEREIRAGGNGDLAARTHDWTAEHRARALASLDTLRQPEFCGGCHQQFVPGTGMSAISTLDEYRASPYASVARCIDCHMPRGADGVADHRAAGGNVATGQQFGDDALVQRQKHNLASAVALAPWRAGGGVWITVSNRGAGHAFPTGVTDIREPWVEVQAKDASGAVLARIGGPDATSGVLPANAARLGLDVAKPDGTILFEHELTEATRVPFDARVPSGGARALFVPIPAQLPQGSASLDAVLYYRNVRTAYWRAATGDSAGHAPDVEVARVQVP